MFGAERDEIGIRYDGGGAAFVASTLTPRPTPTIRARARRARALRPLPAPDPPDKLNRWPARSAPQSAPARGLINWSIGRGALPLAIRHGIIETEPAHPGRGPPDVGGRTPLATVGSPGGPPH